MYTNWTMQKSELNDEEYSNVVEWCNEGNEYTIEDKGEYYAVVKIPEPTEEEIKQARIEELKTKLAETDYVVIKIAEGEATRDDYEEVLNQRQAWRAEINELEQQLTNGE